MTRKETIESWVAAIFCAIIAVLTGLYIVGLIPPIGGSF